MPEVLAHTWLLTAAVELAKERRPFLKEQKANVLVSNAQVGIAQLRFEETLRFGLVMAGVVMVAVPTLALLVLGQRQLVRGLTAGAVKG